MYSFEPMLSTKPTGSALYRLHKSPRSLAHVKVQPLIRTQSRAQILVLVTLNEPIKFVVVDGSWSRDRIFRYPVSLVLSWRSLASKNPIQLEPRVRVVMETKE